MTLFLETLFKSHHLVSHGVCAYVVLLCFIAFAPDIDKNLKRKLLRWGFGVLAGVALFLCATGIGLAINYTVMTPVHYLHGAIGFVTYGVAFFFYSYPQEKSLGRTVKIMTTLVGAAVLAGTVGTAGYRYFASPVQFLSTKGEPDTLLDMQLGSIIDKKCLKCHNANVHAGGLNMLSPQEFQKSYVVPDALDSKLYFRILDSVFSSHHMPLYGGQLSATELSVVRRWIDAGGREKKDIPDRGVASVTDPRLKHWSYQKVNSPLVPHLKNSQMANNQIDHFVLSAAEKAAPIKLAPVDKNILTRRLSLVLTGRPPEMADYGLSFEVLKEKYLNSIGFVENFGVHWMDLVAFADDEGIEPSLNHQRDTTEFRKYLFSALKNEPSYFALLREQLAAPLQSGKPNNRSLLNFTPHNEFSDLTIDFAMATTFSLTLGIDVRCARCHDHPNEPISNENYYQLAMGFLNQNKDRNPGEFEYRKSPADKPKPELFNIFESAKPPPSFEKFSNLSLWVTDVENGVGFFTARVFVDQTWKFVFGKSIMPEAGEFGAAIAQPLHLELLNWLTWDFINHGTSIKHLVDKMVSSAVFSKQIIMESEYDQNLYQAYHYRLLRTENIRDNILDACGVLAKNTWSTPWETAPPLIVDKEAAYATGLRRSFYVHRTRTADDDLNEYIMHFGLSRRYISSTRQEVPRDIDISLFLINNFYLYENFRRLRDKLPVSKVYSEEFINTIYRRILSRDAKTQEVAAWKDKFIGTSVSEDNLDFMFRVLISSNEFLYIP